MSLLSPSVFACFVCVCACVYLDCGFFVFSVASLFSIPFVGGGGVS